MGCQPSSAPGAGSQRQNSAPSPIRDTDCCRAATGRPAPRTPGSATTASRAAHRQASATVRRRGALAT
eukprot:7333899-Lingulodinium_polyedra.AAC.1